MISILYGEETNTHFRMEWFCMSYIVAKTSKSFNWASILPFNIANQIEYPKGMKNPSFYMSSYLIDTICATNYFFSFNWAWTLDQIPIHVYFFQLWEDNCKENFYDLCDYFLTSLYKSIFGYYPHRISPWSIKSLKIIGDWYMRKCYTYVRIFGATGPPHMLPKYVPNKLLVREIAY